MKKIYLALIVLSFYSLTFISNNSIYAQPLPSKVDYDAFEKLVAEVKEHRQTRLLPLTDFVEESKKENVIILDTRSDAMYNAKHIAGAIHLNFSDFTQENLARIIPSFDTKILIYCNNNFSDDRDFFPTKMVEPVKLKINDDIKKDVGSDTESNGTEFLTLDLVGSKVEPLTLALNIPTYINLYGYGYKNVYELSELISVRDSRVKLEGTAVAVR